MQNTQQTYGAVEVAAAAPPKKLGRKVVVVAAALRPLHARGVMSRGDFPSRSASFIGCITGHKGKGDEYHRCKPHSETNED